MSTTSDSDDEAGADAPAEIVSDDEARDILVLEPAEPVLARAARGRVPRLRDPVAAFVAEAKRHPRLSIEEEEELSRRARRGDREAVRRLVLHNLRLVVSVTFQYRRAWANLVDLFQEGSVGLMEAVEKWQPSLGSRFGTYATYWIRAHVLRFLMTNARLVHVGNTRAGRKLFFRLEKERQKLLAAGFDVTPKLLASKLDVDEADVIEVGQHMASREVSTEAQTMGEDGPLLGETIASASASPEQEAAVNEFTEVVSRLMAAFERGLTDERERAIWKEHLAAPEPVALSDLAARFKVSKQRMGQLADRLKKKFRVELERKFGADVQTTWNG